MADSPIPNDVLQFIDRHVTSIDQLEILLLLRGRSERTWSAAEVSQELRSNADAAGQRLQSLRLSGVLVQVTDSDGLYRYEPESPALDALIGQLDQCYRDYRLRVIERVFKKPDGLQTFADAFRIKKERS